MRVLPFTIGDMRFVHTEGDASLDDRARERWRDLSDKAAWQWTRDDWIGCEINEGNIPFAVTIPRSEDEWKRDLFGTWVLYRTRPLDRDPNVITCLPAPMFRGLASVVRLKDENAAEVAAASKAFWRRTFAIMEWMLDNPMPLDGGGTLTVDHWRFPDVEDGDPKQHEWINVGDKFTQYSRKEVDFSGFRAVRMRKQNKELDPDPDRPRG